MENINQMKMLKETKQTKNDDKQEHELTSRYEDPKGGENLN